MQKRIFYIVLFLITFLGTLTSNAQDWLWSLQIAGNDNLETEKTVLDANNNVIVLSELIGNANIAGQSFSTPNDSKDLIILKFNKYGSLLWSFQIGSTIEDDPKDLYIDNNGNIYITGSFGNSVSFGDITITSTDEKDAFLAKISPDGNVIWAKNMGKNTGIQKGRKLTSDGKYLYVVGFYYESVLLSRSADTLLEGSDKKNYFLAKYDLDGNFINAHKIYSSSNKILLSGFLYLNNNLYISGYFPDTLIYESDTLISNGNSDFLLIKTDLSGNVIWAKSFGGTKSDQLWSSVSDGQNIYVSGFFYGTLNIDDVIFESNNESQDFFIGKFDSNGNLIWGLANGSKGRESVLGLNYNNSTLYATGFFSNSIQCGNTTITANANTEPFIATITPDGEYKKIIPITVSSNSINKGIGVTSDSLGNIYFIGKFKASAIAFNSNISLTNTNSGNFDGFIAKYGCFDGLTTNVTDAGCGGTDDGQISVAPNEGYGPFTYNWSNGDTSATITNLSEGDYTVTVSDYTGCSSVATAHITYHPPVSVSTQITNEILCNGDSTGEIAATATDGFPPYTYTWSNKVRTDTISNLPAGDYTITVTDQCGNTATQTVTITQPDSLDVNITGQIYNYFGLCLAHVSAAASGGTDPYSYEWFDLDGNSLGTDDNVWVDAGDYYIVVVTDANNCIAGWYFYVPGCDDNKSRDINNTPELATSEQYPEANGSFSFVNLPNNSDANYEKTSENNTDDVFSKDLAEGLKALGIGPEINVYPNPANNVMNISITFPYDTNAKITLLNSIGQTIKVVGWTQTLSYEKIMDVSNLSNGIYYLMVKTNFGVFKKNISIIH